MRYRGERFFEEDSAIILFKFPRIVFKKSQTPSYSLYPSSNLKVLNIKTNTKIQNGGKRERKKRE